MIPSLSLILLNFNTRDMMLACLDTLLPTAQDREWQIIVVDNGSTDGSAAAIAQRFPHVALLASSTNLGYAGGNNLGLRQATGNAVVLLNSDVIVDASALQALADYLHTHPDVGALSPRLLIRDSVPQPYAFGNDPTLAYLVRRGINTILRRGALHDWGIDHAIDVDWISGACFCVRRSILPQVGLLDERFFLYFEDIDWCLRIRQAGWRIIYNPAWSVIHLGGASQPDIQGSSDLYYQSLLYFYQKHYAWIQRTILSVALTVYRWLITRSHS